MSSKLRNKSTKIYVLTRFKACTTCHIIQHVECAQYLEETDMLFLLLYAKHLKIIFLYTLITF